MTQAASALDRNAEAAEQQHSHATISRNNTLRREMFVREFTSHYDIRPEQIFFDENTDEPYFDFEALSLLVNELADIPSISVLPSANDLAAGMANATCEIVLTNGYRRTYPGSAFLGERMPGGGSVDDWKQAQSVAQVRALRKALRSVSFDPVRAHEAKKNGTDLKLTLNDPRQRELREAHMLGEELGLIVGEDKSLWRRQISDFTQGQFDSMEQMDETRRGHWLVFLRALKRSGAIRPHAAGVGQS